VEYHKWKVCYYDWFAGEIWQKEKELAVAVTKMGPNTLNEIKEHIYREVPSVFHIAMKYEGVFKE